MLRLAVIGDHNSGYPSHREIDAVLPLLGDDVEATWLATTSPQARALDEYDAIWLAPGSPYADDDTAAAAVRHALDRDVPFLGTCAGLQYAVLELSRVLLGDTVTHAEVDGEHESNAVVPLTCSLQGERRWVEPVPGTRYDRIVGGMASSGMHYCSYAPSAPQLERLASVGLQVQATAEDAGAEVLELTTRSFFVLSLFQPQVGALAGEPVHPLLRAFVRAARGTVSADDTADDMADVNAADADTSGAALADR